MNKILLLGFVVITSCSQSNKIKSTREAPQPPAMSQQLQEEVKATALLTDINQLTFAGKRSGEAYFSADGSELIFQDQRRQNRRCL